MFVLYDIVSSNDIISSNEYLNDKLKRPPADWLNPTSGSLLLQKQKTRYHSGSGDIHFNITSSFVVFIYLIVIVGGWWKKPG